MAAAAGLSGAKPEVARTGVEERLNGGFGAEATVNCGRERGRGTDLAASGAAFVAGFAAALVALAVGFLVTGFVAAFLSEGLAWSGFAAAGFVADLGFSSGLTASAGVKSAPETSAASVHCRRRCAPAH